MFFKFMFGYVLHRIRFELEKLFFETVASRFIFVTA